MTHGTRGRLPLFLLGFFLVIVQVHAADQEYRIKSGDTMTSIARHFDISVDVLLKFNNITEPSRIRAGQIIKIPSKDAPAKEKPLESGVEKVESLTYTVESGDTLWGIARKTGIPRAEIMSANGLDNNSRLKTGQVIHLPVKKKPATSIPSLAESSPKGEPKTLIGKNAITEISTDTMLELSDYKSAKNVTWPAQGEQFASSGKLPGVLIKSVPGEEIKAVSSGVVSYSMPHSVYGHVVFIESENGYVYIYGGNESSGLALHQQVKAGDTIGLVGLSPGLKEYYVYFSVYKLGKYVDPARAPRG